MNPLPKEKNAHFKKQRCVFVLGPHRSGTSVLTRSLTTMGVILGDALLAPACDNPKGFFEDEVTMHLNENFLSLIGCRFHTLILPEHIKTDTVNWYQKEIEATVISRFSEANIWGVKDPRLSRLWPYWIPIFEKTGVQPVFLLVNRNPLSVAESLKNRNGFSRIHGMSLWLLHQLDALEALLCYGGIVVDYDRMMDNSIHELKRIASFLDISDHLSPEDVQEFTDNFLDIKLQHTKYSHKHFSHDPSLLEGLCYRLYSEVLNAAHLSVGLDPETLHRLRTNCIEIRQEVTRLYDWMQIIDGMDQCTCPSSSLLTIYWRDMNNQGFNEKRTLNQFIDLNGSETEFELRFPDTDDRLTALRLDISSSPAVVILTDVVLLTNTNEIVWIWDGDSSHFSNPREVMVFPSGIDKSSILWATGYDPRFTLELPDEIFQSVGVQGRIRIKLSAYPVQKGLHLVEAAITNRFKQYEEYITELSKNTFQEVRYDIPPLAKELKEVADLLRRTLAHQETQKTEQEHRFHQIKQELIRAEAQLDLLKDVMRDRL